MSESYWPRFTPQDQRLVHSWVGVDVPDTPEAWDYVRSARETPGHPITPVDATAAQFLEYCRRHGVALRTTPPTPGTSGADATVMVNFAYELKRGRG